MTEYDLIKDLEAKLIAFSDTLNSLVQEAFYAEKDAINTAEAAEEMLENLQKQVSESH